MQEADVADRLAITDVLVRYAVALDARDWTLLHSCFSSDAFLDYPTGTYSNPGLFIDRLIERLSVFKATQHYVTNHVVQIDGDDATAMTYVLAQHVYADNRGMYMAGGVYDDELRKTEEGWRITRRVCSARWSNAPTSPKPSAHEGEGT